MTTPDTLWYTRCPVPTALAVALETGILQRRFGDGAFTIRSLASSPMAAVRNSHYDHSQPSLFRQGGNMPPLMARSRGADVRVVALSWTDCSLPVLTLPGSGIKSPADLAGARLPLPRRGNVTLDCWEPAILRGFERALTAAGLTLDDVNMIELPVARTFNTKTFAATGSSATLWDPGFVLGLQREEITALIEGRVDAIFSESSTAATLIAMFGLETVIDLADLADESQKATLPMPLTVTVSGALLDRQPRVVARWLAALIEAAEWAESHRREAFEILAAEISAPLASVESALSGNAHRQLEIGLDPRHVAALQDQSDFLFEHGYLEREVRVAEMIDHGPLAIAHAFTTRQPPTLELAALKETPGDLPDLTPQKKVS